MYHGKAVVSDVYHGAAKFGCRVCKKVGGSQQQQYFTHHSSIPPSFLSPGPLHPVTKITHHPVDEGASIARPLFLALACQHHTHKAPTPLAHTSYLLANRT